MNGRATLMSILLAAAIGLCLFLVKYEVQDLEDQLAGINRTIALDREAIHVLKAEWSHLNEAERLKLLADRYLDLGPLKTGQFTQESNLDVQLIRRQDETEAAFAERIGRALTEGRAP